MVIILASFLDAYSKDEFGNYIAKKIQDENEILSNIKKHTACFDKFVLVTNDQFDYERNINRFEALCKSFALSGIQFKNNVMLDATNKACARQILQDANLIILAGGKCFCQKEFFDEINIKQILQNFDGLVIGISAGAMNLCNTVANFPEEIADLNEPRWLTGLGFFDEIIIPHFDGSYQLEYNEIDIINDYILPMSKQKQFIGITNNSYILIDKKNIKYYGNKYLIKNGEITKIK